MIRTICGTARSSFRTKHELAMENLALRHQVGVLTRALGDRRPRFGSWDRALWVVLASRPQWSDGIARGSGASGLGGAVRVVRAGLPWIASWSA